MFTVTQEVGISYPATELRPALRETIYAVSQDGVEIGWATRRDDDGVWLRGYGWLPEEAVVWLLATVGGERPPYRI